MPLAPLIPGQLPLGYCYPASPQQFLNDILAISTASVPANTTGVSYGPSDPGENAHDRPWFNTTYGRTYYWLEGRWVSVYPVAASEHIKMLFSGTEAELDDIDNAEGSTLIAGAELTTGPFWEIDHDYDGRFVIGPGELPLAEITLGIGDTGGLDLITLDDSTFLPPHRHYINVGPESGDSSYLTPLSDSENGSFKVNGAEQIRFYDVASTEVGRTREAGGDEDGEVQPFNALPPYKATFIAKRTARLYYVIYSGS